MTWIASAWKLSCRYYKSIGLLVHALDAMFVVPSIGLLVHALDGTA